MREYPDFYVQEREQSMKIYREKTGVYAFSFTLTAFIYMSTIHI